MNGCIQRQCYRNVAGNLSFHELERGAEADPETRICYEEGSTGVGTHEAMLKQGAKLDMTFASFFEVYEADKKQRVKESTWESKSHVIRTKILPYFNRKIAEIEAKDIIAWQNELMAYRDEKVKPYSADYLKTIHAQLTAIFNHAVNFYNLPYNPARRAGTMGNEVPKEMDFWTKEEYLKFSEAMMDKPRSYYAFEMLCWCGIRSGELQHSLPADFDFPEADSHNQQDISPI